MTTAHGRRNVIHIVPVQFNERGLRCAYEWMNNERQSKESRSIRCSIVAQEEVNQPQQAVLIGTNGNTAV